MNTFIKVLIFLKYFIIRERQSWTLANVNNFKYVKLIFFLFDQIHKNVSLHLITYLI